MRIPVEIVYRQLEGKYSFRRISVNTHRQVKGVYFASENLRTADYIYIMTDEDYLPAFYHMSNAVLFLLSDNEPHNLNPTNDVLLFPANTNREHLLNDIAVIFQDYYDWAEQIDLCADDYEGIRAMMDLTHQDLHASLILTDANLQFLYYTKDFERKGYLDSGNRLLPSEATLRLLTADEDYYRAMTRKDVFRFPEKDYHEVSLCYNLFSITGATQGRLMLLRSDGDYTPDDRFILEYLGYRIARILRNHVVQSFPLDSYRQFRRQLAELLNHPNDPDVGLSNTIEQIGWKEEAGFLMITFHALHGREIIAKKRLCNQLEQHFIGAFTVEKDNALYLLLNAKRRDIEMSLPELRRICDPYKVIFAIGPEMDSIVQAGHCAKICDAVSEIAVGRNAAAVEADFVEYGLDYLLKYDMRAIPAELLQHPAVRTLKKHDDTHGTAFIETLRAYLQEDRSPTRTARHLFIHRSTLLERLERMKALILPFNLDGQETRLFVSLSLRIMSV